MIQVIITPEAIRDMGIKHTTHIAISELKKGETDQRSLIFIEGISNVQIANILKMILPQVDAIFSIITRVPLDRLHELTEGDELRVRFLDAELN